MIAVLVWMTRSHSLYDFVFMALGRRYGHGFGLGWEMFIICMGYGDWHGFSSIVDMMC